MQLTIHRGTKEIGGSCVELRTGGSRILIDFGMPLVSGKGERFDSEVLKDKSIDSLREEKILPDIEGLYKGEEKGIDAILISHSHLDHYGFLSYVNPDIPVYMSMGARELIDVSNIFITKKPGRINASVIRHMRPFGVGEFRVTPYVVDHSAFDALAFLVEGDGKRVFYSGDFRGHGRKSVLFDRMVKDPPGDIDCLLMEGSMLGRGDNVCADEVDVQRRIEQVLRGNDNITFLFTSSQNIDRLVSAYKACLKTGSVFVIDIYTAFILDKLRKCSKNIPQFDWKKVQVKFTKYHADVLADAGYRALLYVYNRGKINMFDINRNKKRILMLGRDNSVFPAVVKKIDSSEGAKVIYSMWEGYLTDGLKKYCAQRSLEHTFNPEEFPGLFENVRVLSDGEVFEV